MNITSHKLHDTRYGRQWQDEIEHHWLYPDFQQDERWRRGWVSFDCLAHHPAQDRIYAGITSFDSHQIFMAFDRASGEFIDLGYSEIADPFDAKFHRSLVLAPDGCLYGAVALLHDVDHYHDAPGGSIIRYRPETGELTRLVTPLPHVYIQGMELDAKRNRLYCMCFAPEYLASYDLDSGDIRNLGLIGTGIGGMAQGENLVIDDDGCVWCGWQLTRAWQSSPGPDCARLCKYDPQADRIHFFNEGLPWPDQRPGYAKVEGLFNLGDGYIYASGASGSLYRVDPQTGAATWLFTPTDDRPSRLTSLAVTDHGIFGVTGRDGHCELMRVDLNEDGATCEKLGRIVDADGEPMHQCHHLIATPDGALFLGENDHPERSGYLWEIQL